MPDDRAAQTTAIAEYNQTAFGLADLRSRLTGIVYDVTTTKGMEAARVDRRECVKLRTALEAKRVELKQPALDRTRLIDAEAKRITAEIVALEAPIDAVIRAQEEAKQAERERLYVIERDRLAAISARIEAMRGLVFDAAAQPAAKVATLVEILSSEPVDATTYQEKLDEAKAVHAATLEKLCQMRDLAQANEAEAAKLAQERVELDAQRIQQEATAKAERERAAAEQAKADAAAKAERDQLDKIAAAQRAELEAEARAAREAEERRQAELAAEQRRQEAAAEQARKDEAAAQLRAVDADLKRLMADPRVASFARLVTLYKVAKPGLDATHALVRLLDCYQNVLPELNRMERAA